MTQKSVAELVQTGEACHEVMTRRQKLEMLARIFADKENANFRFGALYVQVEHTPLYQVRAISTVGTAFEPVVQALNAHGIATAPNVGSVMDNLDLTQHDVHDLVCHCLGAEIAGVEMARRLRHVAA